MSASLIGKSTNRFGLWLNRGSSEVCILLVCCKDAGQVLVLLGPTVSQVSNMQAGHTKSTLGHTNGGFSQTRTSTDRRAVPCFPGRPKGFLADQDQHRPMGGTLFPGRQAGRQADKLSRRPGPAQTGGQSPLSQAGGAVSSPMSAIT